MKPKSEKLFATLVRGVSYTLVDPATDKDKVFLQGQPREITAAERDWLRLHAVDRVTCLAIETDEIIPIGKKSNLEGIGSTVGKDVPKFRFTTSEAAKAA